MNRSILIVIADFLLISLLAFSNFDAGKLVADRPVAKAPSKLNPDSLGGNKDFVNVLKVALDDERRAREQMAGELTQTKEDIRSQENLLTEREDLLAEREKQNQALQRSLVVKEQQARQIEQERSALRQQYAAAQANLQTLQQQLKASTADALISKEKLAMIEAKLRQELEQAASMQQKLAQLETSQQTLQTEKSQLAEKLQISEAEKHLTTQQLVAAQSEVKTVRSEKAQILQHADKLAEGVTTLAQSSDKLADRVATLVTNSGNLANEVREFRPLAANTIFNELATNRIKGQFTASRSGVFGLGVNKKRESETILVTDGTNTFALCHVDETPFSFIDPGTDWESLAGTLTRGFNQFPISRISFFLLDPRVVFIPVTEAQARQLGCRIYRMAANPFKFQDAVLVGAREGYYGECKFQIDLTTPQYVKMDRNLFKGIFGKFNPSRGDLVFTKTGEFLGLMANGSYCVVVHNSKPYTTFQFGEDVRSQHTGSVLARFSRLVSEMPLRLQ